MDPVTILAILSWGLQNAPRVADFIKRHTETGQTLTPDEVKQIIGNAQAESDVVNDQWKNS